MSQRSVRAETTGAVGTAISRDEWGKGRRLSRQGDSHGIYIMFQTAQTFDFPLMKTHNYLSIQRKNIVENFKFNFLRFVL